MWAEAPARHSVASRRRRLRLRLRRARGSRRRAKPETSTSTWGPLPLDGLNGERLPPRLRVKLGSERLSRGRHPQCGGRNQRLAPVINSRQRVGRGRFEAEVQVRCYPARPAALFQWGDIQGRGRDYDETWLCGRRSDGWRASGYGVRLERMLLPRPIRARCARRSRSRECVPTRPSSSGSPI